MIFLEKYNRHPLVFIHEINTKKTGKVFSLARSGTDDRTAEQLIG